jgi:hypothetical protein
MDNHRRMLPEAELWTAVSIQAIEDLASDDLHERQSARAWINSPDDTVLSFKWACHVTDLEPSFVRSALRKARELELKRSA